MKNLRVGIIIMHIMRNYVQFVLAWIALWPLNIIDITLRRILTLHSPSAY